MADESEIVFEDDENYLAVCHVRGKPRAEDGTLCLIEIGNDALAPVDDDAKVLALDKGCVLQLIEALTAVLHDVT